MVKKAVALSFAAGTLAGVAGQSYFFKLLDRRKLHIEYQERRVDEDILKRADEILKFGVPDRGTKLCYFRNFVLNYNQEKKIPNWVAEHLTKEHVHGDAVRKTCRFKVDPDVIEMFSAENTDYLGSGWSRGHMAAAGNHKYLQESMKETFYLSNVVPQNLENNAGFWNRMEIFTRELTEKYKNVYVISGPIMMPSKEETTGKKFIRHYLIGKNDVAVPTHLFKIIIVDNQRKKPPAMAAFIVPNKPIPGERRLQEFQVPLEDIERRKGLTMVPDLDRERVRDLCEVTKCKLMPLDEFELYMIGRKLQSANTLNRLDVVWGEMRKKKLKPDQYINDLYWRRKAEIEQIQNYQHQSKSGQE